MAHTIHLGFSVRVVAQPLTQAAFAPFGDVILNPQPELHPSRAHAHPASLPAGAASANQGSAIRYADVSRPRNLYAQAPSRAGEPIMSVFSCASASLSAAGDVQVRFLERHPFTTQTFTPLRSSASAYLVVVAPSLPPTAEDRHLDLPVPASEGEEGRGDGALPGRGMPNVKGLRAFVATSGQAVTYGPGTWHAPMMVLGGPGEVLDFVVFQFASGVGVEDCQLVEFSGDEASPQSPLVVSVPGSRRMSKL